MRYYIIFGITFILVLIILFYNPFLGIYKDNITIEYNYNEDGYVWNYNISNKKLVLDSSSDNKWVFKANKTGFCELDFNYTKEDKTMYHIYYKFFILGNKIFWIEGNGDGLLDYPNPV